MTLAPDEEQALARFARELEREDAARTASWAEAVRVVPRHSFVPTPLEEVVTDGITTWQPRVFADRAMWLDTVYSDRTLVTALDEHGLPLSSSTKPSLVVRMLEDLEVKPGRRVLEIGTGTGYSTALLCERLGSSLVTSIDISEELVQLASRRLALLGYRPHVVAGDGTAGVPERAPYARIVATCSVPRIPTAWVEQLQPGGVLLADVANGVEGGLVRLVKDGEGGLRGAYAQNGGRFMPSRPEPGAYPEQPRISYAPTAGTRPTSVSGRAFFYTYPVRLLSGFSLPTGTRMVHHTEAGIWSIQLQHPDGSWARSELSATESGLEGAVTWGGETCLWDAVDEVWEKWTRAGRPDVPAVQFAVDGEEQRVWLAGAEQGAWILP